MYKDYYGLAKYPFTMTPDPGCLFLTRQHREAMAGLTYAIVNRKGLIVLSGEVGTGKTTILARVLGHLSPTLAQFGLILHPTLTPNEFLEMAMLDLGMTEIPTSKARRLAKLRRFLLDASERGTISALIIDEAHKLSPELLEEVRLLGNFESAEQKLLQVVLAGQSELDGLLKREDLRQLKQRVAVRLSLKPLAGHEVEQYIRYRWAKAGGVQPAPFSVAALADIIAWSRGVPRVINSICDQALLLAFADNSSLVERTHVREAATDLDLPPVVSASSRAESVQPPLQLRGAIPAIRLSHNDQNGQRKASLLNRWAAKLGLA